MQAGGTSRPIGAVRHRIAGFAIACAVGALHSLPARAAGDEIQVYLDDVRAKGERGLELHSNFVSRGRLTPDYPGEQPPGRVLRVTPEFSFGLGNNWDWGLYLPMSATGDTQYSDYAKLRVKHLVINEHLGGSEFYGLNVELARSPRRVSPSMWAAELRGILGMRRGDWLFATNPILGVPLTHSVADNRVGFEINFKVAKAVGGGLALGFEHYSEFGPLSRMTFGPEAGQTTFAVLDYEAKRWDINFGIGHGWTANTDRRVFKAIVGLPF